MNLMLKAMNYDYPPEIPFSFWVTPAAWLKHPGELKEISQKYPHFFGDIKNPEKFYVENMPTTYHVGKHVDEWGCVWENVAEGLEGIVTGHPLKNREDILTCKIPENRDGRMPHGFMYLRVLDLRGFEEAMVDFAEECDEIQILVDKVLEYNCIQLEIILKEHKGDIVYLGDDLGMQKGLAIGPKKWRKYFKPCYKKIYSMIHEAGKKVYMHTDGMIYEIIEDLFEVGADIVNPQFRANGLDNLVRICKGKYPIDLDLDRQMFPFATPDECKNHVKECVEAFYLPQGGICIKLEISPDIPAENIKALFEAADYYRNYKG